MLNLAILGSTGSVGRQALAVAAHNPKRIRVVALAAHRNSKLLFEQARAAQASFVALAEPTCSAPELASVGDELPAHCQAAFGASAVQALAGLPEVDVVLNALVGAAGLRVSYTALAAGKRLALANKESLVVGGDLLMPLATHETLLPVDSEHSAIYQCLLGERSQEVDRLWLTASGGPFRGWTRERLATARAEEALAHPTWQMGPKISIDSATLMNKGLEVIEAHHLFGIPYDRIRVLVHPQSRIHSMVEYRDGSVKAHLGVTDMRIPIQFALSFPERWEAPTEALDFTRLADLTFEPPDLDTFGCLRLALEAGRVGGSAPCVLNAANEVAVEAFRTGRCGFPDIEALVARALDAHDAHPIHSLEQLEDLDRSVRVWCEERLKRSGSRQPAKGQ
jgi:1-deoxy-D-xylulose-5-phosphate reductoisomerase